MVGEWKVLLNSCAALKQTIAEMVAVMYRDVNPKLHGAAGLSVLAHLEDLVGRGVVKTEGAPSKQRVRRLSLDRTRLPENLDLIG